MNRLPLPHDKRKRNDSVEHKFRKIARALHQATVLVEHGASGLEVLHRLSVIRRELGKIHRRIVLNKLSQLREKLETGHTLSEREHHELHTALRELL